MAGTTGRSDSVRNRVDASLQRVLGHPEFEGAYTGPWWPVGADDPPRAWKRAILRRQVGGGAFHWGHLFLVVGPGAAAARVISERGRIDRRPVAREVFRRSLDGSDLEAVVIAVASSEESAADLEAVARGLWDDWRTPPRSV